MQQQFLNITQIPDDIARLAHEQQLGTPQARYMISKLNRGWRWVRFAGPVGFLFFGSVLCLFIASLNAFPSTSVAITILLPLLIISYLLLIASLLSVRFTSKTCTIYPCDKGLILKQSLTKFRVIRWDEIETIWQTSAHLATRLYFRGPLYIIRCHDGYTLTFSAFRSRLNKLDDFNKTIEEQFTQRRLPFQFADYQVGHILSFGPLSINRDGVSVYGKLLPWEQVANISLLKNRRLIIYKMGTQQEIWQNLPALKIPNISILLALFKRIRSGQSDQEAGFAALAAYGTAATIVQSRRKIDALPEGLAALVEEHKLGERRLDQNLGRSRLTSWVGIISLLVIDAIMITIAVGYGIDLVSAFYATISGTSFVFSTEFAVFSLLLLPGVTLSIIRGFQQIHNYTYTFEHGMILKRGQQAPIICHWDEIEVIWRIPGASLLFYRRRQPALLQRLYAYTLQLRNGAKYTLTRLNINQEVLGKIIKEQVVPLQMPAIVDAFQTGKTINFGQVQVNQQGITVGTHQLPWVQIKSVSLQDSRLVIYDITRRKPWLRLQAEHIPNLFLLFALADYARDTSTVS